MDYRIVGLGREAKETPHGTLDVMVVSAMLEHDTRAPVRAGFSRNIAAVPELIGPGADPSAVRLHMERAKCRIPPNTSRVGRGLSVETWGTTVPRSAPRILQTLSLLVELLFFERRELHVCRMSLLEEKGNLGLRCGNNTYARGV